MPAQDAVGERYLCVHRRGCERGACTRPIASVPSWVTLPPPVRDYRTIPLTSAVRGPPDISYPDVPRPVVELPHLANIHPAPVFADLDLVMGTDLDPLAALLKGVDLSGADHPFANPFALIRPHGDAHLILPVIDDFQEATGFIRVVFRGSRSRLVGKWWPTRRELDLDLRQSQKGGAYQDNSHNAGPSDLRERHRRSFLRTWIV